MKKHLLVSLIASLAIVSSTVSTVFAAMPNGTVAIGGNAFDLGYANDIANSKEIINSIVSGGTIYVKDFNGNWIDNITGLTVDKKLIPAVVYKNASGQTNFSAEDTDANGIVNVSSVNLNKTTNTLTAGDTDTLTSMVYPSDATNKAVIWTSSNSSIVVVTNGVVTAVGSGTATITATTVDGNKTASCVITVNKKNGYVYNTELELDLKVRSAPNLSGTILGYLYNYEKIEILDTITDNSGQWYKISYNNSFAYVNKAYIQAYNSPPENVVNTAVNITKKFEVGNSNQIAGNFDGQGLSLGYLQWNIGQGTLQPLLNRMDRQYNGEMKSIFGANYDAIHSMLLDTPENQLKWAKGINDSSNAIAEPWYSKFISLSENSRFKNIEVDAQVYTVSQAMRICDKYNLKTVRGFALAFDIAVQNGSLSSGATTIIDNALKQAPSMPEKSLLGVIANAVADSSPTNSEDIRSRKLAMVNGQGIVHGSMLYLDTNYQLNDNSWR